ncbi:MAG: metallophosphoesterase, partial [Pirellulaceae bacterium]|nr:metallophosphoesterase [Pirellulaceae bacterium]
MILSDTHLLSADSIGRHYAGNKAAMDKRATVVSENLNRAARQVNELKENPAGLILNGDCVHVGGQQEYALLASKFALLDTIPIHVTMGNHDHRQDFATAFRDRTRRGDRVLLENRHVSVVESRHANLVLLDSLTMKSPDRPVKGPGVLGTRQLEWLESVLDSASDKPAIVVFHHNIDPSDEYQMSSDRKELVVESAGAFKGLAGGLEDSDQFLDLLQSKSHVKAVVTGHMHQFRVFKWRKVHFVSLPAVGYTFDAKEPVGWIRMRLKDGGAEIELQTLDTKHAR